MAVLNNLNWYLQYPITISIGELICPPMENSYGLQLVGESWLLSIFDMSRSGK
jgi:hypothetical protein